MYSSKATALGVRFASLDPTYARRDCRSRRRFPQARRCAAASGGLPGRAPQHGTNAGDQLVRVERLVQIVVRAFLKEQGDEYAEKSKHIVGTLNRYFDKIKAKE